MKEIPPRGPRRIGAGSQTLGDHNHRWVRTRERDRAIYGDERTQTRGARENGGNQWETGDSGHRGKHQKIVLFSFVGVGNHFIPSILGLSHVCFISPVHYFIDAFRVRDRDSLHSDELE